MIVILLIIINRTRTQDGFTDAVSNLGQTEVVLHCCQLPMHASTTTEEEEVSMGSTSLQTEEATTASFSPSETLTPTGAAPEDASTEAFSTLSSTSSPLETSTSDSSSLESSDQIQSAVEEEVELVRTRTGAKIKELRSLLEETEPSSLHDALEDLVATLINISGTETEKLKE